MDFEKICRCCLAEEEPLFSIYDGGVINNTNTLAYMIKSITSVMPALDDKLPDKACISCFSDIHHFYDFKVKCEKSNIKLQQFYYEHQVHVDRQNISKTVKAVQNKPNSHAGKLFNVNLGRNALLPGSSSKNAANKCSSMSSSYSNETSMQEDVAILKVNPKQEYDDSNMILDCNSVSVDIPALGINLKQEYNDIDTIPNCSEDNKKHDNEIITPMQIEDVGAPEDVVTFTINTVESPPLLVKKENVSYINEEEEDNSFVQNSNLTEYESNEESSVCSNSIINSKSQDNAGLLNHCVICNIGFSNSEELSNHLETHEAPYACIYCKNKAFTEYSALCMHILRHTGKNNTFTCNLCHEHYYSITAHNEHVCTANKATSSNEKVHTCKLCPRSYRWFGSLITHFRIHTGERPFKCSYCDRRFMQTSGKSNHEKIHTGEKPWKCTFCEKAFVLRGDLTRHERIHTGEVTYKCRYCPGYFTQASSRKKHEEKHFDEFGNRIPD